MLATASLLMLCSCLGSYLDKAPDSGLNENEVFSKYANFKSYFYSVYSGANFNIKAHYLKFTNYSCIRIDIKSAVCYNFVTLWMENEP